MEIDRRVFLAAIPILATAMRASAEQEYGPKNAEIQMIVMDPMALPLACDCVQGYAQRRYEKLADYLTAVTKKSVRVFWCESLSKAIESQSMTPSIVIGKDSVIRHDARQSKRVLHPVASLTDTSGSTSQSGLFVVRTKNPASSLVDLEGYSILFGPTECDEKALAPQAKLAEIDIEYKEGETCDSCSIAAKKLMTLPEDSQTAAVISSYAAPLLEGCGNIQKGDLRIVGGSDEVPFISAFVDSSVPRELRAKITKALLDIASQSEMKVALETKLGFVPYASL